jgi:hypothetical protein
MIAIAFLVMALGVVAIVVGIRGRHKETWQALKGSL